MLFTIEKINFRGFKGYDGSGFQGTIMMNGKKVGKIWDDPNGGGFQMEMPSTATYELFIDFINKEFGMDMDEWANRFIEEYFNDPTPDLKKVLNNEIKKLKAKYVGANFAGMAVIIFGTLVNDSLEYRAVYTPAIRMNTIDFSDFKARYPEGTKFYQVSKVL